MYEVLVAHPLRLTLQWQGESLVEIALDWAEGAVPVGGTGGAASGECAEGGLNGGGCGEAATAAGTVSVGTVPSERGTGAAVSGVHTPNGRLLLQALEGYVAGDAVTWPELPLAWEKVSPFACKVLQTLFAEVGTGKTVTYGELAAMAGRAGAARAVGGIMARNPWPLVVPCHRVLGANNRLHGFSGAGLPMKAWLLTREGAEAMQRVRDLR